MLSTLSHWTPSDFNSSSTQSLADAQYLSSRPLPTAPDGRYDSEAQPITSATRSDPHSDLYKVAKGFKDSLKAATPLLKEALDPTVS